MEKSFGRGLREEVKKDREVWVMDLGLERGVFAARERKCREEAVEADMAIAKRAVEMRGFWGWRSL